MPSPSHHKNGNHGMNTFECACHASATCNVGDRRAQAIPWKHYMQANEIKNARTEDAKPSQY